MSVFTPMGKMFIAMSILPIFIGIILAAGTKIPWMDKLPGDINYEKAHFSFYFPLTSCIILSVLLILLFYLLKR